MGNINIFSPLGASNHSKDQRAESDFYSTDPIAITLLDKNNLLDKDVDYYECACGEGHLTKELRRLGYNVPKNTDLYDRGFGESGVDFLKQNTVFNGNIITNPPYKQLTDFILKGLELASNKLYIFSRIQTLESIVRYENIFSKYKPIYVCVFVKRVKCYHYDVTKQYARSAVCYAWFIWDNTIENEHTEVKWLI